MHDMNADHMTQKLEDTLPVIQQVSEQFKNPVRTSSTTVLHLTIPDFLLVHIQYTFWLSGSTDSPSPRSNEKNNRRTSKIRELFLLFKD